MGPLKEFQGYIEFLRAWVGTKWPTVIVKDRYDGTYSGAEWVALPSMQIPLSMYFGDITAAKFWKEYDEPVGRGNTPQEALEALEYEVAKLIEKYGS